MLEPTNYETDYRLQYTIVDNVLMKILTIEYC